MRRILFTVSLLVSVAGWTAFGMQSSASPSINSDADNQTWTLERCLQQALSANRRGAISKIAVQMAEAQHRQALSGYWPQIGATAGIFRSDQPTNLIVPSQTIGVPAGAVNIPATSALVTIPANAFGPGFPPANVQLPVTSPGGALPTPAQSISVPQQNIQLLDRDLGTGDLNATLLLFDGGLRSGLRQQANAGIEAAQASLRRTELQVSASVRRYYWGAVLSRMLSGLASDVLGRMEVTLRMTEAHEHDMSGKVTRTDYLYNKAVIETIRSYLVEIEKNRALSEAALANVLGLPWSSSIHPADAVLPALQISSDLGNLVGDAYRFNPDWAELAAGLQAAEGKIRSEKSGYFPKIALKGDLHGFWNGGSNIGLASSQNRVGWAFGAGMEVPVFNGFLTKGKIDEALAKLHSLQQTQLLLRDGLALQVKTLTIQLAAADQSVKALQGAQQAASENQELNMRAYENDMTEPDHVIHAQILAALAQAQLYKAQYDRLLVGSDLTLIIGHEVSRVIEQAPANVDPKKP